MCLIQPLSSWWGKTMPPWRVGSSWGWHSPYVSVLPYGSLWGANGKQTLVGSYVAGGWQVSSWADLLFASFSSCGHCPGSQVWNSSSRTGLYAPQLRGWRGRGLYPIKDPTPVLSFVTYSPHLHDSCHSFLGWHKGTAPTAQSEGSVLCLPEAVDSYDPIPGVSSCELLSGKSALTSV